MQPVAILLLAAGASTRMGRRDKLLEDVDGVPLLRRQAKIAVSTGHPVVVTLTPVRPERLSAIEDLDLSIAHMPEMGQGMSDSIATGLKALASNHLGVAILPADMPDITRDDLRLAISRFGTTPNVILRATSHSGTPGHPVIFPNRLFSRLSQMTGDQGAREILRGETITPVKLPLDHAITDLDTPQAWENWRKTREGDKNC